MMQERKADMLKHIEAKTSIFGEPLRFGDLTGAFSVKFHTAPTMLDVVASLEGDGAISILSSNRAKGNNPRYVVSTEMLDPYSEKHSPDLVESINRLGLVDPKAEARRSAARKEQEIKAFMVKEAEDPNSMASRARRMWDEAVAKGEIRFNDKGEYLDKLEVGSDGKTYKVVPLEENVGG